ncbi:MAG: hypothetical protein OEY22_02970 [Candidatus Bathyarchaeota archaeon]|nr:hypothetical protein [Candidatus Bathyarchaeota archaeon]MDH5787269.1 hypothetical protein [Candidatus Bathyarchaeota archaeon]
MERIQESFEVKLAVDWSDMKGWIIRRIGEMFHDCPYYFFTERDIHSLLCDIANEELRLSGVTEAKTSDGYLVNLVHHEYPTPFRCDMSEYGFAKKDQPPYERGHYDLVILNPAFVRGNNLEVVCAKDFEVFEAGMQHVGASPLIWVCEVMFFPRVKAIPGNAILQIGQDAMKVAETLKHKVGSDTLFCELGAVLVFTNHAAEKAADLKTDVSLIEERLGIEATLFSA